MKDREHSDDNLYPSSKIGARMRDKITGNIAIKLDPKIPCQMIEKKASDRVSLPLLREVICVYNLQATSSYFCRLICLSPKYLSLVPSAQIIQILAHSLYK